MRYVALDDIAFEASEDGKPVARSASPGDVVELTAKDAKALVARGAVKLAEHVEVSVLPPQQLKE